LEDEGENSHYVPLPTSDVSPQVENSYLVEKEGILNLKLSCMCLIAEKICHLSRRNKHCWSKKL